jgi:hypothetical protein
LSASSTVKWKRESDEALRHRILCKAPFADAAVSDSVVQRAAGEQLDALTEVLRLEPRRSWAL